MRCVAVASAASPVGATPAVRPQVRFPGRPRTVRPPAPKRWLWLPPPATKASSSLSAMPAGLLSENQASLAIVRKLGFRPRGSDGILMELEPPLTARRQGAVAMGPSD